MGFGGERKEGCVPFVVFSGRTQGGGPREREDRGGVSYRIV